MPAPIVLAIDLEPDLPVFDPRHPAAFDGFELLAKTLPAVRERLTTITGQPVAFTWYLRLDPQIEHAWGTAAWLADRYEGALSEFVDAGDELGLHTHVWRWHEDGGHWFADFADEAWGVHCIELGLETFRTRFGRPCRAHRGGNNHLSGAMLETLGANDVVIDLTPEPGAPPPDPETANEPMRGLPPDQRGVPTRPFRSSRRAYPQPDPDSDSEPLIVPMLSAPGARPPFRRGPLFPTQRSWLFRPRLRLSLIGAGPPVLSVAMRSNSAAGPGWPTIVSNLERLAALPGAVFVTASAAQELLAG